MNSKVHMIKYRLDRDSNHKSINIGGYYFYKEYYTFYNKIDNPIIREMIDKLQIEETFVDIAGETVYSNMTEKLPIIVGSPINVMTSQEVQNIKERNEEVIKFQNLIQENQKKIQEPVTIIEEPVVIGQVVVDKEDFEKRIEAIEIKADTIDTTVEEIKNEIDNIESVVETISEDNDVKFIEDKEVIGISEVIVDEPVKPVVRRKKK